MPTNTLHAAILRSPHAHVTITAIDTTKAAALPGVTAIPSLSIAIELEGHCYSRLRSSDDFRKGVAAFQAKRAPRFKGS
jgi:2-oxoglutaroyl-CoA hydrolase